MDCSPLNLAHFHERRAEKFLKKNRFDDAIKAVEMSLLYLKESSKNVRLSKSIEVLETQKWDLERKLIQIQMRKQYERSKLKEIVPLTNDKASVLALRSENNFLVQSTTKSIDETVQNFDAKRSNEEQLRRQQQIKESRETKIKAERQASGAIYKNECGTVKATDCGLLDKLGNDCRSGENDHEILADLPILAPLELPSFDFHILAPTSDPTILRSSIANMAGMVENFQK